MLTQLPVWFFFFFFQIQIEVQSYTKLFCCALFFNTSQKFSKKWNYSTFDWLRIYRNSMSAAYFNIINWHLTTRHGSSTSSTLIFSIQWSFFHITNSTLSYIYCFLLRRKPFHCLPLKYSMRLNTK